MPGLIPDFPDDNEFSSKPRPNSSLRQWSLSPLRERPVKIGAKIIRHGRSVTFQMAEVMISRGLFQHILGAIALRPPLPPVRC